ncbi:pyridoxamine 5'-phosphate oxidase family protein [Halosimplex pelagicum]|uniref:Pyridoxamine 5'-phosphate oxidase family protein n=1 Tax=Halosimplex pelagicum TaxID=869886 RepID=A0A7D5T6H7_9EURY|nr:pyridoxamine 5'-phosphate oxidase family protein [Halosimplex pelagicum]QLH84211.1 pyridoxamine 5'-phosphate oxidase family protein [Halosimplex pelagicum]
MNRLSDDGIVDVLAGNGIGVLAMAGPDGGAPYPLPVAYGYDPDTDVLAMQLEGDESNRKHRCLDRTPAVGLSVYEEDESERVWRSVVVTGRLVETSYDEAEPAFAALARNNQSAPNPVRWDDATEVVPFELVVDRWSGRAFEV